MYFGHIRCILIIYWNQTVELRLLNIFSSASCDTVSDHRGTMSVSLIPHLLDQEIGKDTLIPSLWCFTTNQQLKGNMEDPLTTRKDLFFIHLWS